MKQISDHRQSRWYEEGPYKGPENTSPTRKRVILKNHTGTTRLRGGLVGNGEASCVLTWFAKMNQECMK